MRISYTDGAEVHSGDALLKLVGNAVCRVKASSESYQCAVNLGGTAEITSSLLWMGFFCV